MKKLLFHLLIFTLFAAAAGCSSGKDDDGNPDVRFYAVPASLNFEAGKTTLQLSISTTGHWTIVCDDEWLEAVPAEGTGSAKVGITAQANPLAQQRTSSLTIAYGGAEPAVVPVTQKVSGEESVDLFGSTDEMKAYLKARVEACNYAESVTTTAGGVLKFGFKGAATRGVRKEAIPSAAGGRQIPQDTLYRQQFYGRCHGASAGHVEKRRNHPCPDGAGLSRRL